MEIYVIIYILGRKIKSPIINETNTEKRTALAAISFINPAFALYPGASKSTKHSMEVLKSSETKTIPIAKINKHHS